MGTIAQHLPADSPKILSVVTSLVEVHTHPYIHLVWLHRQTHLPYTHTHTHSLTHAGSSDPISRRADGGCEVPLPPHALDQRRGKTLGRAHHRAARNRTCL